MPLYEMKCPLCSTVFDVLRPMRDTTPVTCPKCGAVAEKQIAVANFRVHGANSANGYTGGGKR